MAKAEKTEHFVYVGNFTVFYRSFIFTISPSASSLIIIIIIIIIIIVIIIIIIIIIIQSKK